MRPATGCAPSTNLGRAAAALVVVLAAACSDSSGTGSHRSGRRGGSTTSVVRPAGPMADLSEISGPGRPFVGEAVQRDVPGYEEHEYVATGTATDYKARGGFPANGEWTFEPSTTAPYRTRVLVRRPADMAHFSGTVVVEWLNVSGGVDANPDYTSLAAEITRRGHVWVGVSAQLIGVEGGPVLVRAPGAEAVVGKGLKALDPARYGTLHHPGDGYAYDIYTQVARALRAGGPVTGGAKPEVLLAAGESQSALALTTYYDGVQALTKAFDGFFVHSRGFSALPLVGPAKYADLAGSMTTPEGVLLRGDLDAPVLDLQSEGDVVGILNSVEVRQPDTNRFRLWEVAGTSHADVFLLGPTADSLDCGAPINSAPFHLIAKAGLRALDTWVRTGRTPPVAPRLEVTGGDNPHIRRDRDGIALGGIRTPVVDVPVDILSGEKPPNPDLICLLMGSTRPLPPARIAELYPDRATYVNRYRTATRATIKRGFVLADDRQTLLGYSRPSRVR